MSITIPHHLFDSSLDEILTTVRRSGRRMLTEPEGLALVHRALGLRVPRQILVRDAREAAAADLESLPGGRVVVKVVSAEVLHKSDVGGVVVADKSPAAVAAAVAAMAERFTGEVPAVYAVTEYVDHDPSLGGQLLLGLRWTDDFGPVVTLGLGGIYTELLAGSLEAGRGVAIFSPALADPEAMERALADKVLTPLITGGLRGQSARLRRHELDELLRRCLAFAERVMPEEISELEVNPLALTDSGPAALDALVRLGRPRPREAPARPLEKLRRLLEPRSAAVIGVSRQLNPGRIILQNLLEGGFNRERLYVVKPGCESLDGCRCVPDLASLPERVDLLVVAVDAAQAPAVLESAVAQEKAESVILIPGGLGERAGSEERVERLQALLADSRTTPWRGPVINGGNCLGIRSLPGGYDTLFIPAEKLPYPGGEATPLAFISQSGAFAIARMSQLANLNPRYLLSIGNQLDLTLGDYLTHLRDDPGVVVFACYVEGFQTLDGRRWLAAVREITASGRPVILYRAGRTLAGARATASHTASVAGDYAVTRELARCAGAVVAESLADFQDLVRLFCRLRGKPARGLALGALSNAGFESVAFADNLVPFHLATFAPETTRRLEELLASRQLTGVVAAHNPLDVTPIFDDEAFAAAARWVLDDPGVDAGIVGCVPLTGALSTLPPGGERGEDLAREGAVASRLTQLAADSSKPWVAVVDAGPLYDPLARFLEEGGIPTFRTADRALRLLGTWCRWQLDHGTRA